MSRALAPLALSATPLGHARRCLGSTAPLAAAQRLPARSRPGARLCVRANELNKWADRSNYDEGGEHDDWSSYDRETANLVLRVLTSKAAQRLLTQLGELDGYKQQWLHNYLAAHPPSEGNKFLAELMRQPNSEVHDASTDTVHKIEPANLAHRIIEIRAAMSQSMLKFPKFMELENTEVLRAHLRSSTFVSGSSEPGYKERRGYKGLRRR
ncbi:hypothetical protein COHA_001361 [Chlorella ohadii]|uniref:Uncharacterized protein n=1 Tax=Chlorella ohadii TaxID=2649997 RepID=A0AAD5DZA0_9CHLO|nr:hypothetical protein COHA_001361 [Chlorella ohadii]